MRRYSLHSFPVFGCIPCFGGRLDFNYGILLRYIQHLIPISTADLPLLPCRYFFTYFYGSVFILMLFTMMIGYPFVGDFMKEKTPSSSWNERWWKRMSWGLTTMWATIFLILAGISLVRAAVVYGCICSYICSYCILLWKTKFNVLMTIIRGNFGRTEPRFLCFDTQRIQI